MDKNKKKNKNKNKFSPDKTFFPKKAKKKRHFQSVLRTTEKTTKKTMTPRGCNIFVKS